MCPACSEKWHAALDAPQPTPPINLVMIGSTYRLDWAAEQQRRRADDHWARVRRYQDQLIRDCARNHQDDERTEAA